MNKETDNFPAPFFQRKWYKIHRKASSEKFVNHAVYIERLRDCDVDYEWEFEPVIINDKVIGGQRQVNC